MTRICSRMKVGYLQLVPFPGSLFRTASDMGTGNEANLHTIRALINYSVTCGPGAPAPPCGPCGPASPWKHNTNGTCMTLNSSLYIYHHGNRHVFITIVTYLSIYCHGNKHVSITMVTDSCIYQTFLPSLLRV